jgi:transcriptional regulator with XRE-family HTH domain
MTPGEQLRDLREGAGLSREDLALGLETIPPISARARADWLALIEAGVADITGQDLAAFRVVIELLVSAGPLSRPIASAAA